MTELERLQARCARLEKTLGTLISWMAQSANSPIRIDEAETLLKMLEPLILHQE